MKIKGTVRGDMTGLALKYNSDKGVRYANVTIKTAYDQGDLATRFGPELARVALKLTA